MDETLDETFREYSERLQSQTFGYPLKVLVANRTLAVKGRHSLDVSRRLITTWTHWHRHHADLLRRAGVVPNGVVPNGKEGTAT